MIVIPALFLKEILAPYCAGQLGRVIHIPYGIPYTQSSFQTTRPSDKIRFGYLGSIKRHKGVRLLIDAFNSLEQNKPTLHIHGDISADKPHYEELIQRCPNERIFFNGPYDNQRVGEILKDIDVLVVPSIWRETGPMVILEALASKKACNCAQSWEEWTNWFEMVKTVFYLSMAMSPLSKIRFVL